MTDTLLLHLIVAIIIIGIIAILVYKLRQARKRDYSNIREFPADFVEPSSADEDMRDRFMGANWK